MRRLDGYMLRQIVYPFFFFVLVFTGIIWLTQSLRVIDTIVKGGQSAQVFLEFTALLLPMVLSIVLPISAFAGTLYAVNRMFSDSEITVMMASGLSGTALLRPVIFFAVPVMVALYLITTLAMPNAQREMRGRILEIRTDVAAAFLREGEFLSATSAVTVYVREIRPSGEMLGIFVHDARDPEQTVTYTAESAYLLRTDDVNRLVMLEGTAQSSTGPVAENLSLLRFDQLGYPLDEMSGGVAGVRRRKPSEHFLPKLFTITAEEAHPASVGEFRAEGHEALVAPLYALAFPVLAVAVVVGAGFRRQGFAGRIGTAVVLAVVIRIAGYGAKSAVNTAPELAPLMYLPPVATVIGAVWYLSRGTRTKKRATSERLEPPVTAS